MDLGSTWREQSVNLRLAASHKESRTCTRKTTCQLGPLLGGCTRSGTSPSGSEAYYRLVASLTNEREHGALRIRTVNHPAAARYFNWTLNNVAASLGDTLNLHINIVHVEIINPGRDRYRPRLGDNPA